jgi:Protein of unknown function (DUF3455)
MTEETNMPLQPFKTAAIAFLLALTPFADAVAADTRLPDAIAAPGETVVLKTHAVGQQYYQCKPGADGKLAWTFVEPGATLTADSKVVGRPGAGPSWQLTDGSGITAKAVGNAPGANANDVPWLKLEVTSHKGSGQLDSVTTVQRINTVGGVLKGACDREKAGEGMPYSADYVFLRKP